MSNPFSAAELEEKSIAELRAILADDTLLPLDDDSNTGAILEILEVIKRKENKTAEQSEAEHAAFWTGLLDRYGDEIPVQLEDVVPQRKRKTRISRCSPQGNRDRCTRH
ncbi:MAG: DUF3825 domain-containing protein, partial [Oscillospiraceae bacterium]|nr:DUF3825 domain-containing protein [Oscillospiraceae bacterium]